MVTPSVGGTKQALAVDVRLREGKTVVTVTSLDHPTLINDMKAALKKLGLALVEWKKTVQSGAVAGTSSDELGLTKTTFTVVEEASGQTIENVEKLMQIEALLCADLSGATAYVEASHPRVWSDPVRMPNVSLRTPNTSSGHQPIHDNAGVAVRHLNHEECGAWEAVHRRHGNTVGHDRLGYGRCWTSKRRQARSFARSGPSSNPDSSSVCGA